MPYAMYIDESGDFRDGEGAQAGRISLVGGWIAKNDDDHDSLRQSLIGWYQQVQSKLSQKEFHATHWRRYSEGRALLKQVFELTAKQNPYAVMVVENRTKSTERNADSTYLDMLVELIVMALFDILENRENKAAFPLQVYVAERRGVQDWEIRKLVDYRLRALMAGSIHRSNISLSRDLAIHIRKLKQKAENLSLPNSKNRKAKTGLMPELILADFLCNSLYQYPYLSIVPSGLTSSNYHASFFITDPYWKDMQVFRKQKRWIEIITETASPMGEAWISDNPAMQVYFEGLQNEALGHVLGSLDQVQKLISTIDGTIRHERDFNHAAKMIEKIGQHISSVSPHLEQTLTWNLTEFGLTIANHTGDNKEAVRQFESFQSMFARPEYQRTEFIQSVPDNYNRYAISITDHYEFQKAEQILLESIAVEKRFLEGDFNIQGRLFQPLHSDVLGQLYSTLGQLRSKQACREPDMAEEALSLFDKAEIHMQQSIDPSRQRNYRIEALLASGRPGIANRIHELLTKDLKITPDSLFAAVGYASFDAMYWLRWMLIPENDKAASYVKVLLDIHSSNFLALKEYKYPNMSILYSLGQLFWRQKKADLASTAWQKAAAVGRDCRDVQVLQTLSLRPLCELALNIPDEADAAVETIRNILAGIRAGEVISPEYFEPYFPLINADVKSEPMLKRLRDDIPYS